MGDLNAQGDGRPQRPRRWEEPQSKLVGCVVTEWGRRNGGQTGLAPLRGVAERGEGFPCLEGRSGARIVECVPSVSPAQLAGDVCGLSGRVLRPQRPPPGRTGLGGMGGRLGENRRGRREEPSRTRGAGEGAEGVGTTH